MLNSRIGLPGLAVWSREGLQVTGVGGCDVTLPLTALASADCRRDPPPLHSPVTPQQPHLQCYTEEMVKLYLQTSISSVREI